MDRKDAKDILRRAITHLVGNANSIADIWALYEAAHLIPIKAGPVQLQECRRAFYSGAAAAFELFEQIGDPGFEEDAGIARLEAMKRELQQFGFDVVCDACFEAWRTWMEGPTSITPIVLAVLRADVARGAGHECQEWQTAQGRCALCDRVSAPAVGWGDTREKSE